MFSDFEQIRRTTEDGQEYWTSRELGNALGYSTYQKFTRILNKAIAVANNKCMKTADHFNQTVEIVKLGSGTFLKVENIHLSRMACLIIAENADGKKPQVQIAREYFKQEVTTTELAINRLSSNILLYKTKQGEARIEVVFNNETFWMSQKRMAELYDVDVRTVNYHLAQIFESGELQESATIRKIGIVQMEGDREVNRPQMLYNLDAIIAVGYRVNSYQATQFRIWATSVLKEMIVKGFVLDDERLKKLGGGSYWKELLERIRDIRATEKVLYRQILEIYATSIDYDPRAQVSQEFFKKVQNKIHYAIHGHTAAELIVERADAEKDFMGLLTFKGNHPTLIEAKTAKNYLDDKELRAMGQLVSGYLDFAERQAEREQAMTMNDWVAYLDRILTMTGERLRQDNGTVSHVEAMEHATTEYRKYKQRTISDVERDYLFSIKAIEDLGKKKNRFVIAAFSPPATINKLSSSVTFEAFLSHIDRITYNIKHNENRKTIPCPCHGNAAGGVYER